MKSKKGISALLETVLLILVVLAAAGIIFGAVIPMLRAPVERAALCSGLIDATANANGVTITQLKEGTIDSIQINALDASGKANSSAATNKPTAVGASVTTTPLPIIAGGGAPVKVNVVAIVLSSAGKKVACPPIEIAI